MTNARPLPFALTLAALLSPVGAGAQEQRADVDPSEKLVQPERAATARTYVNLRGGASSTNELGVAEVCVEASPFWILTIETCGTGAGVWRGNDTSEMAHFRLELQPYRFVLGGVALDPQIGLGFAEMQIGGDEPGFRFGDAKGKLDTSGPEISLSIQAKVPLRYDLELVTELSSGLAYFASAPELAVPHDELQPFAGVTLGLGF
jgi:hypothetical protein